MECHIKTDALTVLCSGGCGIICQIVDLSSYISKHHVKADLVTLSIHFNINTAVDCQCTLKDISHLYILSKWNTDSSMRESFLNVVNIDFLADSGHATCPHRKSICLWRCERILDAGRIDIPWWPQMLTNMAIRRSQEISKIYKYRARGFFSNKINSN